MGTSIPKCGMVVSSERIIADVWSALEVAEGLKPVAGNTSGEVKALTHQGASLEPWVYTCLEAAELDEEKQEWQPLLDASIRDGINNFTGEVEPAHL